MKFLHTAIFLVISFLAIGQKQLRVNGNTYTTSECALVTLLDPIPNGQVGSKCDIRDAQIVGDCLEITLMYGGCNGNLELYTDNKIASQSDTKLNFRLVWQEPSFCKLITLVKVSFDLKPYKALIKDKSATINLLDTNFNLYYSN